MDKINLDGFPPEERQWVVEFRQILEKVDLAHLAKQEAMIESVPHSATEDDIWLQEPCVYTLFAYGVPGVEAIHRVAVSNSRGLFDARRALIAVADGDLRLTLEVVSRTERYMDDGAHQRLVTSVNATFADDNAKSLALRLLGDSIRAIVTTPNAAMK